MRLAVALDLRDLVQRLPLDPGLGIFPVHLLALVALAHREHDAVGQVAIMRQGQHIAAGALLVGGHPLPQVPRIRTAVRRGHGERLHLARLGLAIAVNDDTVHVVALDQRGPFIADEGGKLAGVIMVLGRLDDAVPGCLVRLRAGQNLQFRIERVVREFFNDVQRRLDPFSTAGPNLARQLGADLARRDQGIGLIEHGEQAHVVRMVRHHQPVERPRQAGGNARARGYLLAAGEPVGIFRAQARAERARIHRQRSVQMGVAPVHAGGEAAIRIGREAILWKNPFQALRIGWRLLCARIEDPEQSHHEHKQERISV